MTRTVLTAIALLVLSKPVCASEVVDRRQDQPGVFPVIEAETLRGRRVRLPDRLKGERNLLLIAYEREQQEDIDTWLSALADFPFVPPAFAYYELPTIGSNMRWMRAVIDGGMKRGIPDRALRDRVITLYLDVAWFRAQIETDGRDDIAALLVDRSGVILGRWYGPYVEGAGQELRAALAGVQSQDK